MSFKFLSYDKEGIPIRVQTYDGYCETVRNFNIEEDGWMLNQIDIMDYDTVRQAEVLKSLANELNVLRRENFELKKRIHYYENRTNGV